MYVFCIPADIPQPNIALVYGVVKEFCRQYYEIGICLGVSLRTLEKIKGQSMAGSRTIELSKMLTSWFDEGEDVTWENLAQALDQCDFTDAATAVRKKYIQQVARSAVKIRIEIKPDVTVVQKLESLEFSFSHLLAKLEDLHSPDNLKKGILFLNTLLGEEEFHTYQESNKILKQLCNDHLDTFNIDYLRQYVLIFDNEEMIKVAAEYDETKEQFLASAAVRDFQQAVISKMESVSTGDVVVNIVIPKRYATKRIKDDIKKLALLGLEGSNKPQVRVKALAL